MRWRRRNAGDARGRVVGPTRGWAVCALLVVLLAAGRASSTPVQRDERVKIPGTDVSFDLVYVPGGTFRMGSDAGAPGADDDEIPAHEVRVAPFWIGRHEVTHDEFDRFRHRRLDSAATALAADPFDVDGVTRPSPPYEDPAHGMRKSGHPAVGMTRRAALAYARWLSEKTGRLFRLPTEAEWELACRLGSAPVADGEASGAWVEGVADRRYRAVGEGPMDALGLVDLRGNVAEWVLDSYDAGAYATRAGEPVEVDPVVGDPPSGRGVVRGGSYRDALVRCADRQPEDARWKRRDPQIPKSRWWNTDSPHVGFRLVSPVEPMSIEQIRDWWNRLLGPTEPPGRGGP